MFKWIFDVSNLIFEDCKSESGGKTPLENK